MSELSLTVDELRNAAQSLASVADSLVLLFTSGNAESEASANLPAPPEESKSAPKAKLVTLEQVRAVLAEKSRSGHTAEVRELLLNHGAAKLSEIDPVNYKALLAEAEVLA